jgi:hypothetical protein
MKPGSWWHSLVLGNSVLITTFLYIDAWSVQMLRKLVQIALSSVFNHGLGADNGGAGLWDSCVDHWSAQLLDSDVDLMLVARVSSA